MITNESYYFSQAFELPNKGLSGYFAHVRKGSDEILTTRFYEGRSMEEILAGWLEYLRTHLKRQWPGMYQFEEDLAAKVGPMSTMAPLQMRMGDIDHYFEDIYLPQEPIDRDAIEDALSWFGMPGLYLRAQRETVRRMRVNTNSGCPFFTNRKSVIPESWPDNITCHSPYDITMFLSNMKEYKVCAILGHRGQEGGPEPKDQKQRVVWMFPFSINIEELRMYQMLIEYCQKGSVPRVPAWRGQDFVDTFMTQMFDTRESSSQLVMCTDFSKFDQHFNPMMQEAARTILQAMSRQKSRERELHVMEWFDETFPIKYNIPLAYDWGRLRFGPHGMGSGSGGTNADETLAHKALRYEAARRSGNVLNRYSQCLGDDGILTYQNLDPDDVLDSYTSHGLEMNPSKQEISDTEAVYLRRYYNVDYRPDGLMRGVYSTCRALGRLRFTEREFPYGWTRYDMCLRVMAILENCKWHPCKEAFADYVMEGDPMRIGVDDPGFLLQPEAYFTEEKLASIERSLPWSVTNSDAWRESGGIQGIRDWWIYKYLVSKL